MGGDPWSFGPLLKPFQLPCSTERHVLLLALSSTWASASPPFGNPKDFPSVPLLVTPRWRAERWHCRCRHHTTAGLFAPCPSPSRLQVSTELLLKKMTHKSKTSAQGGGACSGASAPTRQSCRWPGSPETASSEPSPLPFWGQRRGCPAALLEGRDGLLLTSEALQEAPRGQGLSQVSGWLLPQASSLRAYGGTGSGPSLSTPQPRPPEALVPAFPRLRELGLLKTSLTHTDGDEAIQHLSQVCCYPIPIPQCTHVSPRLTAAADVLEKSVLVALHIPQKIQLGGLWCSSCHPRMLRASPFL